MTEKNFIDAMQQLLGYEHFITDDKKTAAYRRGFRFGGGEALGVAIPRSLLELWQVAKLAVTHDVILILQAANTGLTGGSTPYGDYDRPVLIVSTVLLNQIQVINEGKQVIAFPGSRLYELEEELAKHDREPHSVIGSSCIGASVVGGVCNNSGGALVQRGPAYTELSLYARINEKGELDLINHLGVHLGDDPETILKNLETQAYTAADIEDTGKAASDPDYQSRVRDVEAKTPSRFNNDGRRLYEASGCAGKLIVFAVRLDTFEKPKAERVFYIGSNDSAVFTELRRRILKDFKNLPVSGEYLHRDYFDVCDKYGKDSLIAILKLGSDIMPRLFAWKNKVDRFANNLPFLPKHFSDRCLQFIANCLPDHLPKAMREYRDKYAHHLILHMSDAGIGEAEQFLTEFFKTHEGGFFAMNEADGKRAILHRFVAGGAAKRYYALNEAEAGGLMALDIALPRNAEDWFEKLPESLKEAFAHRLYCGHFLCYVMHQDYILKKGQDAEKVKAALLRYFDEKGAEYPAEHNVGQLYLAKEALRNFYRENDPTNSLNPGIGKTPKGKNWTELKRDSE